MYGRKFEVQRIRKNGLLPIFGSLSRQSCEHCHAYELGDRDSGRKQRACARGWDARATGTHARLERTRYRASWLYVTTRPFCVTIGSPGMLGGFVATEPFWSCVMTTDCVVTRCGHGREALGGDTTIVSRQGGETGG